MPGTHEGAKKAVAKVLANNPNHFKEAGRKGGLAQVPKGFALMTEEHHKQSSSKGGKTSKRGKKNESK